MKYSLFGIVLAALLSAQGSWAGSYYTGYKLLEYCHLHLKPEGSSAAGVCSGYIRAVTDTTIDWSSTTGFDSQVCVPDKVTLERMKKIVVKYLEEHPDQLRLGAASLVLIALNQAFPCNKDE